MKYIYSLRNAIDELIAQKNAYVIGEDVMEPYGGAFKVTKGLSDKYPDNVIGVPMCEQGFTALSVGMALAGGWVMEEIMFGDFITLTADQLINHAAKFHELYGHELHLVVRTPSGGYRGYGATHSQSLEKMFLGVPGLRVVAPNVWSDPGQLLKKVISGGKPTLFVENKLDYPRELVLEDTDILERSQTDGGVRISFKGEVPEVTIITYGGLTEMAVEAASQLMYDEEIAADVISVTELSESPEKAVDGHLRTDKILVVEEGTGGFGYAAQAAASLCGSGRSIRVLTSMDSAIPSAESAECEVLVQKEDIFRACRSLCV